VSPFVHRSVAGLLSFFCYLFKCPGHTERASCCCGLFIDEVFVFFFHSLTHFFTDGVAVFFLMLDPHHNRILLLVWHSLQPCRSSWILVAAGSFFSHHSLELDPRYSRIGLLFVFLNRHSFQSHRSSSSSVDPIDVLLWQLASILSTPIASFPSERTHVHFHRHAADPFLKPFGIVVAKCFFLLDKRDLFVGETDQFIRNNKHCYSAASYGCGIF